MATAEDYVDPVDIRGINDRLCAWGRPGETILPVDIRRIVIAQDALSAFAEATQEMCRGGQPLIVVDRTPIRRDGEELKELLRERLSHKRGPSVCELASGDTKMETARDVALEVARHALVIAVGSGSVTDVAKYARHLAAADTGRSIPLVSFPTAASVTAYTSALAVLTVDGVKRTLPARAPDAVMCDLRTIAEAPPEMTRAGFGDALARGVSYGDWFLARELGMDDSFSEVPGRLLQDAERAMVGSAEQIAAGEPEGVLHLTRALLLGGMAMSVVSQTAPLSGWEHAMSHYLDLTAAGDGREIGLHGAQVGVATLVSARAYERCWPKLELSRLHHDLDEQACRKMIEEHFAGHDRSGKLLAELCSDLSKKMARWHRAEAARQRFAERKLRGEYDDFMRSRVRTSEYIRSALLRAGAPLEFGQLSPAISEQTARRALTVSHLIRARFTLGDLLAHCGCLTQEMISFLLTGRA